MTETHCQSLAVCGVPHGLLPLLGFGVVTCLFCSKSVSKDFPNDTIVWISEEGDLAYRKKPWEAVSVVTRSTITSNKQAQSIQSKCP